MFGKGHGGLYNASTKQRKKAESERLRGERDPIKFIDLGFEKWQDIMNLNTRTKTNHTLNGNQKKGHRVSH